VGEISAFRPYVPGFGDVDSLLDGVADALKSGGVFATTFRDYASKPLQGMIDLSRSAAMKIEF
jgi:hypothetical protein